MIARPIENTTPSSDKAGYDRAHRHDAAVEAKCRVHDRTVHVSERSRLRGNRRPRCATRLHCIDIGKVIYANTE